MLSESCKSVIEGIRQLKHARVSQTMGAALSTRQKQLRTHSTELASLKTTMDALCASGVAVDLRPDYGKAVVAELAKLAAAAEKDPANWGKSGFATSELQNLERLESGVRKAMLKAWTACAADRVQSVGMDDAGVLLDVLAKVRSISRAVTRIRDLQQAVSRRCGVLPQSVTEIEAFDADLQELTRSWGELKGDGIPKSVLTFLRQAGQGHAPLALLDDDVRAWLREHHIEDAFHVVIGG